jgi:outer membrane protein OmpA-like peptidoglycan-associated protein
MKFYNIGLPISIFAVAAVLASTGCATKKYVRNTVSPVQTRVSELDQKTAENASAIEDLETKTSRADERAMTADSKAMNAAREAEKAQQQAALANQGVQDAKSLAETGINKAGQAQRMAENYDNYKLMSSEKVHFGFNQSDLTKEAKEQLDEAVKQTSGLKHFVVEVQGFTDKTGPEHYNLDLSRRRATAVVRYLNLEHKIPLYRIHVLGYGEAEPVADNSTREGRKQNRRVEVRFFGADLGGDTQVSSLTPN